MSHPYCGIAIVVGISEYKYIDPLKGAVNDANEMTKNLKEHHFDVIDLINPSIDQIVSGVRELNLRLSANSYNVVVVYYAGHGVADFNSHFILGPEYADDKHQLVINGLNIERDIIDQICAINVPGRKKRSLLVILDTCRKRTESSNNEFRLNENQRGNEATIGILVGYACGRGLGAADGHHGLYTQFILEEFFKPGVCVLDALSKVNNRVPEEGGNGQIPQMVVDDLNCFKFCFNKLPETLEELKEKMKCLKAELERKRITMIDRKEENDKINTMLEEQIYIRDGVKADYNNRITALDNDSKLLQAENEKLKLEKKKLEELKHVQINQGNFQLENSTRENQISDSEIMEMIYECTGGALWTKNEDILSWQPNDCTSEFKEADGRITYIDLSNNNLIGKMPQELGWLSYITCLNLSRNRLRGEIPVELGNLSELEELNLYENELTGAIPVEIGKLLKLKWLIFSGNQLTGAVPKELGKLSKLIVLWLYDNQLTGGMPLELRQLSELTMLRVDGNQLTGKIPKELGKLKNLKHLGLNNNQLTGKIPKELGELKNLIHLGLHNNQLTGKIPKELGELKNLIHLRLHNNQLTGTVPAELGKLSKLTQLFLDGNQLTGGPPIISGCIVIFHPQRTSA